MRSGSHSLLQNLVLPGVAADLAAWPANRVTTEMPLVAMHVQQPCVSMSSLMRAAMWPWPWLLCDVMWLQPCAGSAASWPGLVPHAAACNWMLV